MAAKRIKEVSHYTFLTFRFNRHSRRGVVHKTADTQFLREVVDERTESDTLNDTAKTDSTTKRGALWNGRHGSDTGEKP
jgi:hypothetical protein